jgi:Ser/Thr protein kinase RdoA (MazF antagonist)
MGNISLWPETLTMDLALLCQAWPIAGPWHLAPLSGGTNNQIWSAQAADGKRYVLRLVPDLTQQARLCFEAALLSALSKEHLPFHVPLPIPTHSGNRSRPFRTGVVVQKRMKKYNDGSWDDP